MSDESINVVEDKLNAALASLDKKDSDIDYTENNLGDVPAVNDSSIIKQGLAEIAGRKELKGNPFWIVLVGSSLFWYKNAKLEKIKGNLCFQNMTVKSVDHPFLQSIEIAKDSKVQLYIIFKHIETQKEWLEVLHFNKNNTPGKIPKVITGKGISAAAKAKKAIAGKVATSVAGKAMAKATINEESKDLINRIKRLISAVFDAKTANNVENDIIKLFVEYHYLNTNGQLEDDSWMVLDKDLREAFKISVRITNNRQSGRVIPEATMVEWIGKIIFSLKNVEKSLFSLLQPHVQAKTLNRITEAFSIIGSEEFLKSTMTNKELEKDAYELTYAMERYLQFSW